MLIFKELHCLKEKININRDHVTAIYTNKTKYGIRVIFIDKTDNNMSSNSTRSSNERDIRT